MIRRFGSSPKPVVARALEHLAVRRRRRPREPVADAVVAGEVRGRLGGGDEVVAGQPVLDRARQLALPHLGAELRGELDRRVERPRVTPGSIPSASFSSFGTPIRRPVRSSAVRELDRLGQVDGRRVARVAAGDDASRGSAQSRTVFATGPIWSRLDAKATIAVARDGAVGRAQADVAAERRRLLDRAAGVGAERPRREAGRDRGRRAAARAAGHARRGPTGCATGRRPSSRSTSPSRTRPCSSCRAAAARAALQRAATVESKTGT